MHRALWLLLWLRFKAWLRRLKRNAGTAKGAVLALLGVLVLLPCLISWFVWLFLEPGQTATAEHLEEVRRFGPLGLLAYCVLTIAFSSGERAISFTPAEVEFLFCGPFSRRQLLGYKIAAGLLTSLMTALFLTVFLHRHAALSLAAYVSLVLGLLFLQLFAMSVALVISTVGARAYNLWRKIVLVVLVALVLVAFLQIGKDLLRLEPAELLRRVEQSPLLQVLFKPLRWFVEAFTAEHLWPDFAQGVLRCLAVDGVLLALVFALDAHYLETSAAVSERIYAQLQRIRGGGAATMAVPPSGKPSFNLPSFPWWGGVGPIAWRQLTTVLRSFSRIIAVLIIFAVMLTPALISFRASTDQAALVPALGTMIGITVGVMTLFLTPLVTFDFRGDIDRLDVLKTLPIAAHWLAVGQLVAPVLLLSILQWTALAVFALMAGGTESLFWSVAALIVPLNFLLIGLENLLFLLFPARIAPATPGDFQALGRQMLLYLAKLLGAGLALSMATLVALPVYFLTGQRLPPAVIAAWLVLAGCGVGLIPLIAFAFRQVDVARDTPP